MLTNMSGCAAELTEVGDLVLLREGWAIYLELYFLNACITRDTEVGEED